MIGPFDFGVLSFLRTTSFSAMNQTLEPTAHKPHAKRPDSDNIVKAVLDGLNLIAYHDDAQVWAHNVRKVYSEHPGVTVMLTGEVAA